ncbi:MAG: archaemetzincin family Zn-dependent metalloprotease [Candidatus Aenigmatarchaeota archaeon]
MKLTIIPFGKIPERVLNSVKDELRNEFGLISEILPEKGLPKEYYNPYRHQYIATQILDFLSRNFKGRILGITDQDLYAEELNFVFGQAQLNGRVAIVSIARLNPQFYKQAYDEEVLIKRAVKEAIHEMGHVLGLKHCENPECVMSFSNTVFDVDRKTKNICEKCRKQLKI